MKKEDITIEKYHSFKPSRFPILDRMEIQQTISIIGEVEVCLELALRPETDFEKQRLNLSFIGVRDLCFQPLIVPIRFSFLQIGSISEMQWEGVAYKASESEQDTQFSFQCRDFAVDLAEDNS